MVPHPPDLNPDRESDRNARRSAVALGLALPGDVVLYLLLPMYAEQFGLSLPEVGLLLAANRLVRVVCYGWIARFYARHGDRRTGTLAIAASAVCALGYALLSGFWALLPLRLLWGLAFGALNLSAQVQATTHAVGAARRSGLSRAYTAFGPVFALPLSALCAMFWGPRPFFFVLAAVALAGWVATRRLPRTPHQAPHRGDSGRRRNAPGALDIWSFLEGLVLDGLFIVGLSFLGRDVLPGGAVMVAGGLMALRYFGEIVLSPVGGRLAERYGALRLLVWLSVATACALIGFGAGWLWSGAAGIIVLRSLQLPLLPPLVMLQTPGPERVQALARRSMWRDIGAGAGPVLAGLLLPVVAPLWIYGAAAALLGLAAWACARSLPRA